MLSPYEWRPADGSRVPKASDAYRTPVLYHRGTWLASQGYAPNAADPLGSYPFLGVDTVTPLFPTVQQFGEPAVPYGGKSSLLRAPTTILYNGRLEVGNSSTRSFTYMDTLLRGMSSSLDKKNVFTAGVYNDAGNTGFYPMTMWIPGTNILTPKGINESTFDGGNLLVLTGVRFHTVTSAPVLTPVQVLGPTQPAHLGPAPVVFRVTAYLRQACIINWDIISVAEDFEFPAYTDPFPPYTFHPARTIPHITNSSAYVEQGQQLYQAPYNLQQGYPIGTPDPIPANAWRVWAFAYTGTISGVTNSIETTNVAHDLSVLARVVPRFRNVRHIMYARNDVLGGTVNPGCAAIWQGIGGQASEFNTIMRGPYEMTADLGGIIRQDVEDWLGTL